MVDYNKLSDILMKWSFLNKEYKLSYILFNEYKTTLPVKYLYDLPDKKIVKYSNDLINHFPKEVNDYYLKKILQLSKKCKYDRYDKIYGYKKI